jgi:hypothetical protein
VRELADQQRRAAVERREERDAEQQLQRSARAVAVGGEQLGADRAEHDERGDGDGAVVRADCPIIGALRAARIGRSSSPVPTEELYVLTPDGRRYHARGAASHHHFEHPTTDRCFRMAALLSEGDA